MTVELLPVGVTCNLRCSYCYETQERCDSPTARYNREIMLDAVENTTRSPTLFGGEPLLLNLTDLEELLAAIFKKWGKTQIQTNGSLITERHIALFKKYKTSVGISLDGPDELNDSRWIANEEATRKRTAVTHWAIKRLCEEKIPPGLIVTLHAGNASKERFPKFLKWLHELDKMGIGNINLHIMELDGDADKLYLPQEELADRLIDLWNEQQTFKTLRFRKFDEILALLRGKNEPSMCHWKTCDPQNTESVTSVDHDGAPTLCRRSFKDGIRWLPAEGTGRPAKNMQGHPGTHYHPRQLALYVTPQEVGGCQGCPFWLMCYGHCPGEAEQNDWRMRTHYCHTMKRLFEEGAKRLRAVNEKPLCDWNIRPALERMKYQELVAGGETGLGDLVKRFHDQQKKQQAKCHHGSECKHE